MRDVVVRTHQDSSAVGGRVAANPLSSRPAAAMGLATGASRLTGLARTIALAGALGVTAIGDAYNTANTVPNMVFTLVVGGVLTSAVVPILVQSAEDDTHDDAAGALLGVTIVIGVLAVATVMVLAPAIVAALSSGARGRGDYASYADLTVTWLRWFAPQIGLYAIGVLAVSIMTARRRLFLGAAAPILTNLVVVGAAVAVIASTTPNEHGTAAFSATNVHLLGLGTTLAVGAATAVQLWGAYRCTPGLQIRWDPRHRAVRQLGGRGGWMILYVAVNQVGLALIIGMASATEGGVSAYQWAFMLMQLPYALIAVSVLSAAYPSMSQAAQMGRSVRRDVSATSITMLRFLVPSAVGLALLALPVASVLVGPSEASLVASATRGFAVSLVPFAIFQLLTRVCFAHSDTRTPAIINIGVNAANVSLALLLLGGADTSAARLLGLAAAHGLSYVVGVCVLLWLLSRRDIVSFGVIFRGQAITLVAAAVMAPVLWWALRELGPPETRWTALVDCAALTLVGALIYGSVGGCAQWMTRRRDRAQEVADPMVDLRTPDDAFSASSDTRRRS